MKPEELICKAQRKDNGEWIEGFYLCLHHNDGRTHLHHLIIPLEADLSRGTPLDQIQVEVVPESITLKAQEPHVITKDDFSRCDDFGYIPAVFEPRDMPNFMNWEWSIINQNALSRNNGRYWSGIPSDEQQEAVKWE